LSPCFAPIQSALKELLLSLFIAVELGKQVPQAFRLKPGPEGFAIGDFGIGRDLLFDLYGEYSRML
jgi:hypothetical protein